MFFVPRFSAFSIFSDVRIQGGCNRFAALPVPSASLSARLDSMKSTYDIAGFTIVLDKITMISAVFQAKNDEGWQFNIRLVSGDFLPVKRPDRAKATLDRELLVKAINEHKDD